MQQLSEAALALAMIASFVLALAGLKVVRNSGLPRSDRRRGALMLVAAFVLLVNVLIWAA